MQGDFDLAGDAVGKDVVPHRGLGGEFGRLDEVADEDIVLQEKAGTARDFQAVETARDDAVGDAKVLAIPRTDKARRVAFAISIPKAAADVDIGAVTHIDHARPAVAGALQANLPEVNSVQFDVRFAVDDPGCIHASFVAIKDDLFSRDGLETDRPSLVARHAHAHFLGIGASSNQDGVSRADAGCRMANRAPRLAPLQAGVCVIAIGRHVVGLRVGFLAVGGKGDRVVLRIDDFRLAFAIIRIRRGESDDAEVIGLARLQAR